VVSSNGSQEEGTCEEGGEQQQEVVEKEVTIHHRIFWGVVLDGPAQAGPSSFSATFSAPAAYLKP